MAHQWQTRDGGLKIEEEGSSSHLDLAPVLSAYDAERIVSSLQKFRLEDVGTKAWFEQHENIEKLNLQAHQSASSCSDEFVLEAILTYDKIETLVHDLLLIEIWKEKIYPLVFDRLAGKNSMRVYFILYHEATLINFFEILLFHKHFCEAGGELMIEFVDYSARKLTKVASGYNFRLCEPMTDLINKYKSAQTSKEELEIMFASKSPEEELEKHLNEIEFRVCISSCSIIRFLCENAECLTLSTVTRIADTHDILMLVIPLIENPPWTRRLTSGKWQKLVDYKWKEVPPIDLLKITKLEGQPWLTLYHILAKKVRHHLNLACAYVSNLFLGSAYVYIQILLDLSFS